MTDEPVVCGGDADEQAWRELVEQQVAPGHDCVQRAGSLAASRRAFDPGTPSKAGRWRWAIRGLVLLAIPLIVYSEITTPTGAVNYSGMGIGVVLMLAGGLSYL